LGDIVDAEGKTNRWLLVFVCGLALIVGQGSINVFAAGVFLKPVGDELGFGRGVVSSAVGVSNLMIALAVPFFGSLIDRNGVRGPLLISIALFALATAAMYFMPASIAGLLVFYGIAGLVGVGQNPGPYSKIIAQRFDKNRGLALGLTLAGVGLGTALIPVLSAILIGNFGWRVGYVGLGVAIIVLAFIPVYFLIDEVSPNAGQGQRSPLSVIGFETKEAVRDWRFWSIAVAFFIGGLVINGSLVHVVPLLTDRGYSVPAAVAAVSSAGIALIIGRVIAGYLMDRVHAPIIGMFFLLLPLAGLIILGSGSTNPSPIVGAVLIGLGIGVEIDLLSYLITRYFGLRSFGTLHGIVFTGLVVGQAAGAASLGWAFQTMGSYTTAFVVFDVLLVIACVCLAVLGKYRFPAS
jgi:MFS family permease